MDIVQKFREEAKQLLIDADVWDAHLFKNEKVNDGIIADSLGDLMWAEGVTILTENGKITLEQQYGGEGVSDHFWLVFRMELNHHPDPIYIKIDGYYVSWDGHTFEGATFRTVKPQQKLITEYI